MSNESMEAKIARIDERINTVLDEVRRASEGRKHQYEKLEDLSKAVLKVENRVENVEKTLSVATPAIDEFMIIKHKVVGAGVMGKWLWGVGGALLSAALILRESITSWLK